MGSALKHSTAAVDGQNVRAAWEILFIILSAVYRRGFGWAYHNQGQFGLKGE